MSYIIKKSISIAGHRTSLSLEEPFWEALKDVASAEGLTVPKLVQQIEQNMTNAKQSNLSSFIKVYVLEHYRSKTIVL